MDLQEQVKRNLLKHLLLLLVDKSWFSIVIKDLILWPWAEYLLAL